MTQLKEQTESDKENVYCVCRSNSAGRMIACDNQKCQYQWFHYSCIGMKCAPRGTWYCSDCKKVNVQNKTCTYICKTSVDVLPSKNQALCEYCTHGK